MKVVLFTETKVERFAVLAEMGWVERRPELGALCRLARDRGEQLSVPVVQQALPGVSRPGAENIVRWCGDLGLCDGSGALTPLGEDVATTDEAPVPEQGVYDVWATEHPLLGARILHAERLAPGRDGRFDQVTALPLSPESGRPFTSVLAPHVRVLLRSLPSNHGAAGGVVRKTTSTCRLRWVIDVGAGKSELQLEGALDGASAPRSFRHRPEHVELDPWAIVQAWSHGPLRPHGRWNPEQRHLEVGAEGLTLQEKGSFRRDLTLEGVEVAGFGRWERAELQGVPIAPASCEDASRWAGTLLERRLVDSAQPWPRRRVRKQFVDLVAGTPLEAMGPTLPSHDALLERYRRAPELFWRLAAPVDLAVVPPGVEETGALRVGGGDAARPPTPHGPEPTAGRAITDRNGGAR